MQKFKIAIFGDSISAGQKVSIERVWTSKVASHFSQYRKQSYELHVFAINGNTTRMALERMPADIQAGDFNVLFIQFGLNDCNRWLTDHGIPRVTLNAFQANLYEMIERAYACGIEKVFLMNNHPTLKIDSRNPTIDYEKENAKYAEAIRNVACERGNSGVVLVDTRAHFIDLVNVKRSENLQNLLHPDGIHLSEIGHDYYAKLVISKLEKYLFAKEENQ